MCLDYSQLIITWAAGTYYLKFNPALPSSVCQNEEINVTVEGNLDLTLGQTEGAECFADLLFYPYKHWIGFDLYLYDNDPWPNPNDLIDDMSTGEYTYDCSEVDLGYYGKTFVGVDISEKVNLGEGNTIEVFSRAAGDRVSDLDTSVYNVYVYTNGECKCLSGVCCDTSSRPYKFKASGTSCGTGKKCDGSGNCIVTSTTTTSSTTTVHTTTTTIHTTTTSSTTTTVHTTTTSSTTTTVHTTTTSSTTTTIPPTCSRNSDCGTDGYVGDPFCGNDDWPLYLNHLYWSYRSFTCNNPGTPQSSCSNSYINVLQKFCGRSDCTDWKDPTCYSYCDGWGTNFCKSNNVYHSRTCHSKGCSGIDCYDNTNNDEQLVQTCSNGCSNGQCIGPTTTSTTTTVHTTTTSSTTTTIPPTCARNSDCGTDTWVGSLFCVTFDPLDVYQNHVEYRCIDAGTSRAHCVSGTYALEKITCTSMQKCENAACHSYGGGCADGDNGLDYSTAGSVIFGNTVYSDYCYNGKLYEYYCKYDKHGRPDKDKVKTKKVKCTCLDGKCLY